MKLLIFKMYESIFGIGIKPQASYSRYLAHQLHLGSIEISPFLYTRLIQRLS